jgi:hypothetical protein
MVGVPDLLRWLAGPSLLTDCPICREARRRIIQGPKINEIPRDVRAPMTVRTVIYFTTPKLPKYCDK